MFERYTEQARRVIFFSRYEASQFGSPYIEPEHFLLGLLRERASLGLLLPATLTLDAARRELQAASPVQRKTNTSVDLPMGHAVKRILAYAAEDAERLNHRHIGTQHLLLGMLHEETRATAMLRNHGVVLEELKKKTASGRHVLAGNVEDRNMVDALRENFSRLAERLSAEEEPASIYRLPDSTE
jgi:ATP-dependent Clp protease ATP-binding subunit ClpC